MAQELRQFFIFTKAEKRAAILLIAFSFVLLMLPYLLPSSSPKVASISATERATLLQMNHEYIALQNEKKSNPYFYSNAIEKKQSRKPDSLFKFDPNTIDVAGWQKLGLSEKQATVIENYKAKGGKFRKPEDIRKIFVMSDEKKEELLHYVFISDEFKGGSSNYNNDNYEKREYSGKSNFKLDINKADSADFERLRGIGAKLSSRIVKYRGWLGGFYEVAQIKEVWGLPDSTFQKIKPQLYISKPELEKIAINSATYEDFRKHPYTRPLAKQILKYRDNNNPFVTINDFCRVPDMSDSICKKLLPYLDIE
jgi:competence protein ComEA